MRTITHAAAYLPEGSTEGRRTAGPDEDGFTLAATALERLPEITGAAPPAQRLFLVGELPSTGEADLTRLWGGPLRSERFGPGEKGLRAALGAATDRALAAESVLLIAVDLAADAEALPNRAPPTGPDGAVAVRIETAEGPDVSALGDPSGRAGSIGPLIEYAARERAVRASGWGGNWDPAPSPVRPGESRPHPRPILPPVGPVSQGAYVPRPSYLESIPSRWRLEAERCAPCGTLNFPARGRCRDCGMRDGLVRVRLDRDGGQVVAATTIGPGGQPTEFDEQVATAGPFQVVLVELAVGARATLQATDHFLGELTIGARVATRLRRLYPMEGEWRYGRKAIPFEP
ncbi:MAG: Zn-ribbon domain-containing OB-fold protein [Thermoplasmata archaeon]